MANENLNMARTNKKDEFYTQLRDIESEMQHYQQHFKNKVIYCNCDDYRYSNFWKYFKDNFNQIGIKKLVSTCYIANGNGLKAVYDGTKTDIEELIGDGNFNSEECANVLKGADIVVTNPPFSLFREYIKLLEDANKDFLVVGSLNAITYKDFFPLIKDNKIWLGNNQGQFTFKVPMEFEQNNTFTKDDKKYAKFGNIAWYTNLDLNRKHKDITLEEEYNVANYSKYNDYDIINVDKVNKIPKDYRGIMGVPITFIHRHNPNQFKILGLANSARWIGHKCITIIDDRKVYNRVLIQKV